MSISAVRKALETQLLTISPAIDSAFENVSYTPIAGTPYQQVTLLPAQPANPEMGSTYLEQGMFQVNLFYPLQSGSGAAQARAELIRAAFPVGASLTADGTTVNINSTPEIAPARAEDDRFMVPVIVRWSAWISQ